MNPWNCSGTKLCGWLTSVQMPKQNTPNFDLGVCAVDQFVKRDNKPVASFRDDCSTGKSRSEQVPHLLNPKLSDVCDSALCVCPMKLSPAVHMFQLKSNSVMVRHWNDVLGSATKKKNERK